MLVLLRVLLEVALSQLGMLSHEVCSAPLV